MINFNVILDGADSNVIFGVITASVALFVGIVTATLF
jgi:hypothetical protein